MSHKTRISMTICVLFILSTSLVSVGGYEPEADIVISFDQTSFTGLGVGDEFIVNITVAPTGNSVDTVAMDLINFTAGNLGCMSVTIGNLFNDSTIWMNGDIDNVSGTLENVLWASQYPTVTTGRYVSIRFKALLGGNSTIMIDESKVGCARNGSSLPKTVSNYVTVNVTENIEPDAPYNPQPPSGTTYLDVYNRYINVTVTDPDNDTMDVSFYWGNDTFIGTIYDVENNTVAILYLPDVINPDWLSHDRWYYWYAVADDGAETRNSSTFGFTTCKAWDLNVDKKVNALDISLLVSHYRQTLVAGSQPWDINNDGRVNALDVSGLISHYRETY